jgi:hypothetical protein
MILCKIIGHNWRYFTDRDSFGSLVVKKQNSSTYRWQQHTLFRICKRCSKKQLQTKSLYAHWRDTELNLDESRDKKLKSLGI